MNNYRPSCFRADCFRNKCHTYCSLLTEPIDTATCPFHKTESQNEADQIKAHNRLVKLGRQDLIQKYEYNPARKGEW